MKRFLIALQFLTILPVKITAKIKESDFAGSLLYFPIVGLVIGLILSLTSFCCILLPVPFMAAMVLVVSTVITGAIHLDGFADTCDGFYGLKPKEEILKIMRDSRIGVMAAAGVALLLLLKFSLLISIRRELLWKSLVMMACFSRWSQSVGCLLSYARIDAEPKKFIGYARKRDIVMGGMISLAIFIVLSGLKSIVVFASAFLPVALFIRYAKDKIGGMTGDTIGAVNEIAETSTLFFLLVFG